jgi:hypothetical protein
LKHASRTLSWRLRNIGLCIASDFSYNSWPVETTAASVCVLLQRLPGGVSSPIVLCPSGGPVKSLLDPTFKYVPSVETDIRKTFARVRREARQVAAVVHQGDRAGKIALLFGEKKRAP